jgi:hypothetical protein
VNWREYGTRCLEQALLQLSARRTLHTLWRVKRLLRRFDPNEPRRPAGTEGAGEWTSGGGGGGAGAGADQGEGRQRQRHPMPAREREKRFRVARRYRSAAVRRLVLAGVAREGQLAAAIGAVVLPDSEPADLVVAHDAEGKPITTVEGVRHAMAQREHAVKVLKSRRASAEQREQAERVLSQPMEFVEVKTLLQTPRSSVRMSAAARKRKERWRERFGVEFHVVAIDDRRGRKWSGHRVYVSAASLNPSHRLAEMDRADSMADVLGFIAGAVR